MPHPNCRHPHAPDRWLHRRPDLGTGYKSLKGKEKAPTARLRSTPRRGKIVPAPENFSYPQHHVLVNINASGLKTVPGQVVDKTPRYASLELCSADRGITGAG